MIVYLGLGSNVGDRLRNLRGALERLAATDGIEVVERSSVYETEPVGEITDQADFYNAAVKVESSLSPQALLARCKQIEADMGRKTGGPRHGPRVLDIDLLLAVGVALHDRGIELPHPELTARRFVLEPLLEVDRDLILPDGTRLEDSLSALGDHQRVERIGELHAEART